MRNCVRGRGCRPGAPQFYNEREAGVVIRSVLQACSTWQSESKRCVKHRYADFRLLFQPELTDHAPGVHISHFHRGDRQRQDAGPQVNQ